MSRYLLLVLVNLPFIIAAVIGCVVQYKLKRVSRRQLVTQVMFWIIITTGLILAQPLYEWLFSHNLTQTEPLSLFDVVQLTAIISLLYMINRAYTRIDNLEQRFRELHEELSIRLSKDK